MKKLMFANLAIALATMGAGQAFGQQYVPNYSNFGASSYPIQTQVQPQVQTPHNAFGVMQMPQVPSIYGAPHTQPAPAVANFPTNPAYNQPIYQLASVQDGYAQHAQPTPAPGIGTMQPVPDAMAHAGLPQQGLPHSSVPHAGVPMGGMQHNGTVAPSYATTPGYGTIADYGYQQNIAPGCSSCGPTPVSQPAFSTYDQSCGGPVAFNAPGYSRGFAPGGFNIGGGNFAGRYPGMFTMPGGAKPWFFGANALIFQRVDGDSVPLSLRDSNNMDVLATGDARMGTTGGFQLTGGRYFNCGRNAIQGVYWGLFPDTETRSVTEAPGGAFRSRILGTGDVQIGYDPTGAVTTYDVYDWFDGAETHLLTRSSEFQNVEINLLGFGVGGAARNFNRSTAGTLFSGSRRGANCGYCGGAGCGACGSAYGDCGSGQCYSNCQPTRFATGPSSYIAPACGSRLNMTWLAGFRYFRFEDDLQYAADFNGDGLTRAVDDLYYDVNVTNDLVGFQWGGRADYALGQRWNLYGSGKVGVYNNRSSLFSRIGTDDFAAYEGGMPTMPYVVDVTDNQVAFLSDLGTGLGFCITPKWSANVGYSAVIASGVATAPGNVRARGDLLRDQRNINNNDVLILHGINLGANYNF